MAWLSFTPHSPYVPQAPSRRECHTVCVVGEKLYLYGGNDDAGRHSAVHILDTVSMRWEKIEGEEAGRRSAHTAVMSEDGKWMYIFGGWNGADELGEVVRFGVESRRWERVLTTGTPPSPRHFHMATRVGNSMYVFGGYDGVAWRNDLVALDLDTHIWRQVAISGPLPGPRASATLTYVDEGSLIEVGEHKSRKPLSVPKPHRVVLWGGYNGEDFLNDMWILHIPPPETTTVPWWESVLNNSPQGSSPRTFPSAYPRALEDYPIVPWPSPRSGHTCDALGSGVLLFVAGRHRSGRNAEVYILDCGDSAAAASTVVWHAVPPVGEPFKPRKTHAGGVVGGNLYLFGGHSGSEWCGDLSILRLGEILRLFASPPPTITIPPSTLSTDLAAMIGDFPLAPMIFENSSLTNNDSGGEEQFSEACAPPAAPCADVVLVSTSAADEAVSAVNDPPPVLATLYQSILDASAFSEGAGGVSGSSPSTALGFQSPFGGGDDVDGIVENCENFLQPHSFGSSPSSPVKKSSSSTPGNSSQLSPSSTSASSKVPGGLSVFSSRRLWGTESDNCPAAVITSLSLSRACDLEVSVGNAMQTLSSSSSSSCYPTPAFPPPPFSDVTFLVENSTVHLHRSVLSSRCDYFKAMFSGEWCQLGHGVVSGAPPDAESKPTLIHLPDVSLHAFLALVRYIYTDQLPPPAYIDALALPLLAEAQRLNVTRLSLLLQSYLSDFLNIHTALSLLCAADTLGTVPLKQAAAQFCARNIESMKSSMDWIQLRQDLKCDVEACMPSSLSIERGATGVMESGTSDSIATAAMGNEEQQRIPTAHGQELVVEMAMVGEGVEEEVDSEFYEDVGSEDGLPGFPVNSTGFSLAHPTNSLLDLVNTHPFIMGLLQRVGQEVNRIADYSQSFATEENTAPLTEVVQQQLPTDPLNAEGEIPVLPSHVPSPHSIAHGLQDLSILSPSSAMNSTALGERESRGSSGGGAKRRRGGREDQGELAQVVEGEDWSELDVDAEGGSGVEFCGDVSGLEVGDSVAPILLPPLNEGAPRVELRDVTNSQRMGMGGSSEGEAFSGDVKRLRSTVNGTNS